MSLTGSVLVTLLKIVGPALGKTLVDNLGIENKLTHKLLEQAIDAATGISPEGNGPKNLERQVQKLANRLQSDMQPIFEHEARNLDEGSQRAIFMAVAETLLKGSVSLDGLINSALDADRLTEQLLKAHERATTGFSANENALYKQALKLASTSLIEIVPQLEGFQLSLTQVMLRQNEELICLVRSQKEIALQQRDHFLTRYRQIVARQLDRPDRFGVPLLKNLLSQQRLCEAYVQLSITEITEESEDQANPKLQGALAEHQRDIEKRSQSIEKALSTRRRLIIRGGAGAGKTSLMHWLAVHAAQQDFDVPLQQWKSLIPFFIRLRDWVDKEFPAIDDFVQPIARNIVGEMPAGWVRQQLDNGCALVLIDGVDELPRNQRQAFFEALQKLVDEFPHAIYIATSRPAGLKDENGEEWTEWENWIKIEHFSNCVMEPMTWPKIQQFIMQWHSALPEPRQQEERSPQKTADRLIRQLQQRAEIRKLAETPLLCTIICALHYDNEGTLPSTRVRLYDKCIEMLLEERDKQRNIKTDINLTLEQKEEFLQNLAYWLMENGYSDAALEEVDHQFQNCLRYYNLPNVTGSKIRQFLLERSGLLREPLVGRIDFVHRTFQEYLAAKAALHNDAIGVLLNHADDDQWREAIIVAVGKGLRKQQEKLLSGLLIRGNKSTEKQHYLHLLAVACLETGVSIESELRTQIEISVKALLPPKSDDEVAIIAKAGDAVVPLLKYEQKFSAKEVGYCAKTLVQIGSQLAMEQLTEYSKIRLDLDSHEAWDLAEILGEGYSVFSQEIYVQSILSHTNFLIFNRISIQDLSLLSQLHQLQELALIEIQVQDLSPLSQLHQLQGLALIEMQALDLALLSQLHHLKSLYLSKTQVQDLSLLSELDQLQELDLSFILIQDLSPLSQLQQLKTLYLSETQVQDLSPLSQLHQLQELELNATQVQDLSPLSQLRQLQELRLSITQVQDLSPLSQLHQLKTLYLGETQVQDLSPLSQLHQLQNLDLTRTQVQDLAPLSQLHQLKTLYLDATQVQDLSPLSQLHQLQELELNATQVQDLAPLSQLHQLKTLYLGKTQVQDLAPLSQLHQLQNLDLTRTQVQDLAPLSQLHQLKTLYLDATQVQDLAPLSQLHQLQELKLNVTQVQDLAPLSQLHQLKTLYLCETQVQDLLPLTKLTQKCELWLSSTNKKLAESLKTMKNWRIIFIIFSSDHQTVDIE
jgi:hypothetical protein